MEGDGCFLCSKVESELFKIEGTLLFLFAVFLLLFLSFRVTKVLEWDWKMCRGIQDGKIQQANFNTSKYL